MAKKAKILKIVFSVILVLILVQIVVLGAVGGMGPFKFIRENKLRNHPGNAEIYSLENLEPFADSPLKGKKVYFLGSSVTKGAHSFNLSFADYMERLDSIIAVKEVVNGTTLVDKGKNSYISRMLNNISPDAEMDLFVCQLSTNDATRKRDLGVISSSENPDDFDKQTIIGAMEYIIVYAQQTWDCPVVFYTGTRYDSELYTKMVSALKDLQKKYDIGVIDLWNNDEMNKVSDEDYKLYMSDKIHPTQAGYLKWWTPVMEEYLYSYLK